jgi:hypothetical protein
MRLRGELQHLSHRFWRHVCAGLSCSRALPAASCTSKIEGLRAAGSFLTGFIFTFSKKGTET